MLFVLPTARAGSHSCRLVSSSVCFKGRQAFHVVALAHAGELETRNHARTSLRRLGGSSRRVLGLQVAKVAGEEVGARSGRRNALTRRLAAHRFIIGWLRKSHGTMIPRCAQNVASVLRVHVAGVVRAGARNEAFSFGHVDEAVPVGRPLSGSRVRRRR